MKSLHLSRTIASLLLLLAAQNSLASEANPLAMRLYYEVHFVTSDGISHTDTWQEVMYRKDKHVWMQRALPAKRRAEVHEEGHKHFPLATAGRHFYQDSKGKTQVQLVSGEDRVIVDLAPSEHDIIGFSGKWSEAYSLMDPASFTQSGVTHRTLANGNILHERKQGNRYERVEWNAKAQIPVRIESGNSATGDSSLTRLDAMTPPSVMPWLQLKGLSHRDYSDFGD